MFKGCYLHLGSCSSTQDLIKRTRSDWFLLRADVQESGRGSKGRRWESGKGGLYYSLKFPEKVFDRPSPVLLLGACSVWKDTLGDLFPSLRSRLSLKWPNDLLLSNKKLGGFIGEKISEYFYLGVGINVNNEFSSSAEFNLTPSSLKATTGIEHSIPTLLFEWYHRFVRELTRSESSEHFDTTWLQDRIETIGKTVHEGDSTGTVTGAYREW